MHIYLMIFSTYIKVPALSNYTGRRQYFGIIKAGRGGGFKYKLNRVFLQFSHV